MYNKMIKLIILTGALLIQVSAVAITPTFHTNKEINFGFLLPTVGSCVMFPSGAITYYQDEFLCTLSQSSQIGSYTITANPNKIIRIKVMPNLDNGDGIVFNPRVALRSDIEAKSIFNKSDFIEINSGDSGIVNIDLGGDLIINSIFPSGQVVNFNFDAAIQWEEVAE